VNYPFKPISLFRNI